MLRLQDVKVGWEITYIPENNRKYTVTRISKSFGKKFAHLIPVDDSKGKVLKVALPLSESYFAFPDNVNDMLAI